MARPVKDLSLQDRVTVLRSATLMYSFAAEMLLTEPGDAQLRALQRELLKRGRQFVRMLERGIPMKRTPSENVIDLACKVRLRAISAALGMPPPRSPPPAARSAVARLTMLPGSGTGFQSFVTNRELPPGVAGDFAGANRRASLVDGSWEYVASPGGLIVGTMGWANPATKQITNYYQTPAASCFLHRESRGLITEFLGIATMQVLGGARPIGYVAGEFWGLFAGGATAGDKVYANAVTGALTAAPRGNAVTGPITSASITAGVLDVATITGTPLAVGQIIAGADVPPGTYIASLASGSGGTGTYNLANVDGTAIANVTAEAMNYYGALETQFGVVDDVTADCLFTGSLALPR